MRKKLLFTIAALTILSANAYGEEGLLKTFVDDSHAELNLEAKYLKQTYKETVWGSTKDQTEVSGQVATLKFNSGYFADIIGFDFNFYGVVPINTGNQTTGPYSPFFKNGTESFYKYAPSIKGKIGEYFEIKHGKMESHHPLLKGDHDFAPSLFDMTKAEAYFGDLTLHGIYATRANSENKEDFEKYGKGNWRTGEFTEKPIQIFGAEYEYENYRLYGTYGVQNNMSNYLLVEGEYNLNVNKDLRFNLASNYRRKEYPNELSDQALGMVSGRLAGFYKNLKIVASASKAEDANNGAFGTMGNDWKPTIVPGCHGDSFYTSGIITPGNHYGEKALKLEIGYDFEDLIKGLYISSYYVDGRDFYTVKHDEIGYGVEVSYTPPKYPSFKIMGHYAKQVIKNDGSVDPWAEMDQRMTETMVTVMYTTALF